MFLIDYVIIAIISLSSVISLVRGFVREVLSVLAWIVALWLSISWAEPFKAWASSSIPMSSGMAILILLVASLLVLSIINFFFAMLFQARARPLDRLFGIGFGLFRGALVVVILIVLIRYFSLDNALWYQSSMLLPWFTPWSDWLQSWIAEQLPAHAHFITGAK